MKTIFTASKTIVHEIKIIMVILKLLYINKNIYFHDGQKVFSGRKIFFLFESVENVGKVLSGNKTYFQVPKIISEKKICLTDLASAYCTPLRNTH
jgi:hypothetical protein